MKNKITLLLALFLIASMKLQACSMCKITKGNRTFVGNNEDAWGLNPKIWFEIGQNNLFSAAYVGHKNNFPQGGMNETGLTYDAFKLNPKESLKPSGKISISEPSQLVKIIMQSCRTVKEVELIANQYNRSIINGAMFLFIDPTGKYLIVEADTLIHGNEANFVMVNFRPSETENPNTIKIPRYHKGVNLLKNVSDTTLTFCASVMDTMKACRGELGDGTLYTSVYDLNSKIIRVYFYHDYTNYVDFDLENELSKGDHTIYFTDIFNKNFEYEKLKNYLTISNNKIVRNAFVILSLITIYLTIVFSIIVIKTCTKSKLIIANNSNKIVLLLSIISNGLILILLPALFLRESLYYFGIKGSLANYPFPLVELYPIFIAIMLLIIICIVIYNNKRLGILISRNIILNIVITIVYISFFSYWNLIT